MASKFELAHRAWPILVRAAAERRLLTYGELALPLGYKGARVMRSALSPIQDYCIERDLPRLTSIVVNKRTGTPGPGYITDGNSITESHNRVFSYTWEDITPPFPSHSLLVASRR